MEEAGSQTLHAALRLRELILDGELPPGVRVAEVPLSERIGVSRTPLRLALARLEHEGLLTSLSSGGFIVRQFTREEIADAIELRGVLEGTAGGGPPRGAGPRAGAAGRGAPRRAPARARRRRAAGGLRGGHGRARARRRAGDLRALRRLQR